MHYANKRPAFNGDTVLYMYNSQPLFGVIYNNVPGNDFCNGWFAPLGGGAHIMVCLADCILMSDVLRAAGIDLRQISSVRNQLALIPIQN